MLYSLCLFSQFPNADHGLRRSTEGNCKVLASISLATFNLLYQMGGKV